MSAAQRADLARTDPADCMPWCQSPPDGHLVGRDGVADACSSGAEEITLSTGDVLDDGPGEPHRPDSVRIRLWSSTLAGAPVTVIDISHHDEQGPSLTAAEARHLAGTLLRLADTADQLDQAER
jgi:hypothetical protein